MLDACGADIETVRIDPFSGKDVMKRIQERQKKLRTEQPAGNQPAEG